MKPWSGHDKYFKWSLWPWPLIFGYGLWLFIQKRISWVISFLRYGNRNTRETNFFLFSFFFSNFRALWKIYKYLCLYCKNCLNYSTISHIKISYKLYDIYCVTGRRICIVFLVAHIKIWFSNVKNWSKCSMWEYQEFYCVMILTLVLKINFEFNFG